MARTALRLVLVVPLLLGPGAPSASARAGRPVAAADTIPLSTAPRTRPERTGYEETSRYSDVIAFIDSLRMLDPGLDVRSFGYSEEGRPLPLVVFGARGGADAEAIRADPRLRAVVLANIHAGEVAGKEARSCSCASWRRAHDAWLDSVIVLVAPIYNADGNERIGLRNRPGQYGPLAGMGQRANARGLDLNRDNMKLDAAEGGRSPGCCGSSIHTSWWICTPRTGRCTRITSPMRLPSTRTRIRGSSPNCGTRGCPG